MGDGGGAVVGGEVEIGAAEVRGGSGWWERGAERWAEGVRGGWASRGRECGWKACVVC